MGRPRFSRARRHILAGGLTALLLAAAAVWGGAWWRPAPPRPEPRMQTGSGELAPGIYLLGDLGPAAAYVVDTSAGLVLIDTGPEPNARRIQDEIQALRLDVRRLHTILLTHSHGDHSLGARHLRELTGARVYAGRGDSGVLRRGGPRSAFTSVFSMDATEPHPTPLDGELAGFDDPAEVIDVGEARFRVLATPGHTPGSVCYLLERHGLTALFAGDVVISLSSRKEYGGLGTYTAYLPPRFGGDARAFAASLRKLQALPPPDLVLPGHPHMDRKAQSPRVPPEQWRAMLASGVQEMDELVALHERDGADFLDGEPKAVLPGLLYLGDLNGQAVYCLDTPGGLLLVDAGGGAELPAFLAARLRAAGSDPARLTAVLLTACTPEATSGLQPLVAKTGCKVVAARAGLAELAKACPPGAALVAAEDAAAGLAPIRAIPLAGRVSKPMAYVVSWHGKTVLFSGSILFKKNPHVMSQLRGAAAAAAARGESIFDIVQSLQRLRDVRPDVWLPRLPVDGQNANLYGTEWFESVSASEMVLLHTSP